MTHYDTLGIEPSADPAEIRRAYLRRARADHPDLADDSARARGAAERRMQQVNEAWAVLSDPSRRDAYDRELRVEQAAAHIEGTPSPGFVPFDAGEDPEDPAAEHDLPYGDGSPVPRALQLGPLAVLVLGVVALGAGGLLDFTPLVALGVVGLVGGFVGFAAAPVYAVMHSHRQARG